MNQIRNFQETKLGDKFATNEQYGREWRIVQCEKITPKRVVIGGWKYDKETGRGLGRESWSHPPAIYELTNELRSKIQLQKMRKATHGRRTDDLTDDQVQRIYAIINEKKESSNER